MTREEMIHEIIETTCRYHNKDSTPQLYIDVFRNLSHLDYDATDEVKIDAMNRAFVDHGFLHLITH